MKDIIKAIANLCYVAPGLAASLFVFAIIAIGFTYFVIQGINRDNPGNRRIRRK